MSGVDYSVWDHIYVSDDEDATCPFVDTPSLFRMRHRSRLEKMVEFQQRGEDLETSFAECRRLLEEAQGRLAYLEERMREGGEDKESEAELKKVQAEIKKLKQDEESFEKLLEEHRKEEKKLPWNVDTISKDGFSKSVLNIKPLSKEETGEEKVENHKNFLGKYGEKIKHFGMLRHWDDSQQYQSDHPHLVCEETANYLVVICIEYEIDEVSAVGSVLFILDLARTLKVDPRGCFRQFFSKIKTLDKPYQDAFEHELEMLKERVRSSAQTRMEKTVKELEEEEIQKRLGPGGLDPVEVYESLPKVGHICRQTLERILEQQFFMCIDSGLWVPDSRGDEDGDEDEDGDKEED
uniref:Hsp90 co-chaperone Cdc37 n=1 Tax=Oreochromis aureus TaxID=47969 RepID=A0AAZ1Y127_OREAU